jgi:hypothetical protein
MKTRAEANSQKTKHSAAKTASQVAQTIPQNSYGDSELEAALQRRVGDVVPIAELIRPVLRMTLAHARRHHREAA